MTSNVSRKRHSIMGICSSYKKSRSTERMTGPVCWPEAPEQPLLRTRVKIYLKVSSPLTISPKFSPHYKNSWSLNTTVTAVFREETVLTLLLRMRIKESPNYWEQSAVTRVFALLWETKFGEAKSRNRLLTGSSYTAVTAHESLIFRINVYVKRLQSIRRV